MKLSKEPKEIDFIIKSEPWTETELTDFRALVQKMKAKNNRAKTPSVSRKKQPPQTENNL